jgi:hypothetical protein
MERLGARATPSVMFFERRLKLIGVSWVCGRQYRERGAAGPIYF